MRTKNTLKNIIMNFLYNILNYGLRFASRIIFVKVLAEVYLGVNGLLSNVLGLLALTELGIGSAIGFSLYKPLAEKDDVKISSLMKFYRKAYRIVFFIVLVVGIILLPFLPYLIKDTTGIENLSIIYLIYLLNMVVGYLFSYKRTLINADQKNYKILPFTMVFSCITTVLQIIVLLVFKNYIVYLLIQSVCTILEHIIINHYINKRYPLLKEIDSASKLDDKELSTIKTNIKALLFHKIGSYVITSTDNLIISKYIGIIIVGLYSNYCLIINMIASLIQTVTGNLVAGFGNLIASENEQKRLRVFNEVNLICYIMYGVTSVCLINLFAPSITYLFGSKYLLSNSIVYIIVINYYFGGMCTVLNVIQSASGLYEKDKYVPLIQSIVNLAVSIILAKYIGLLGVFIGTFVSMLIPLIIKPIIMYKYVFIGSSKQYFFEFIKQVFTVIISLICSSYVVSLFTINNFYLNFICKGLISALISSIFILMIYYKSQSLSDVILRIKHLKNK